MILTILVFIIVLGLIIFVHELGHFISAKKAGCRVDEFGFGFPPRVWSKKVGETEYSLNLLPIGGFVKIHGEEGQDRKNPRSFASKPAWVRAIILAAGVFMNLILAALLLSVGFFMGLPEEISDEAVNAKGAKVQITYTAVNSPAQLAELQQGDTIFEMQYQDETIRPDKVSEVQDFINDHRGLEMQLIIQRGDELVEKKVTPRLNPPVNEGAIGVALARTALVSYPWYVSIYKGFVSTYELTATIIVVFSSLIWEFLTRGYLLEEVGGPVKIFVFTGQAVKLGFIYILQFAAILNINIAIINALPFPALDGGRLLFLLVEKIKGSPINQKVENYAHTIGFALLILLMLAITWRDIAEHVGRLF